MKHWMTGALAGLFMVFLLIQMGSSGLAGVETSAIHLYQRFGSPVMDYVATCRFTPTCSHYAVEVLQEQGFWKGNLLIVERLISCSPVGVLLGV
jgi:hypothetical protein